MNPKQTAAAETPAVRGQALFFNKPTVLEPKLHNKFGLKREGGYEFAAKSNSVPLGVQEFPTAGKHYPIAFTMGENALPVAVLGIERQQNLFVDKKGRWRENTYIPAYVRLYPFALAPTQDPTRMVLCFDEEADRVTKNARANDLAFFENDQPSALVKNALQFCGEFQNDRRILQAFTRALSDHKLFQESRATIRLADNKNITFDGFRVVDETAFRQLPEAVVVEWFKNGWLGFVYFHLASLANFQSLVHWHQNV